MQQHQRRDIQDWLNLFEQQKQSGLTAMDYTRTKGILRKDRLRRKFGR
ncbi:hypothetical protein [Alteromonas genovensis]